VATLAAVTACLIRSKRMPPAYCFMQLTPHGPWRYFLSKFLCDHSNAHKECLS
jgi:hypothetical protein